MCHGLVASLDYLFILFSARKLTTWTLTADVDGTIHVGDQLLSVDGVSVLGKNSAEVVDLIRGPNGSWIDVALYRLGAVLNEEVVPFDCGLCPHHACLHPYVRAWTNGHVSRWETICARMHMILHILHAS